MQRPSLMQSAARAAIIMVVTLVLAGPRPA